MLCEQPRGVGWSQASGREVPAGRDICVLMLTLTGRNQHVVKQLSTNRKSTNKLKLIFLILASLVAQIVMRPPAMWQTSVQSPVADSF